MATPVRIEAARLHESDFYLWARDQAEALRTGRLDELDLNNLAEEIDGLAARVRSAVRSRTRTIIEHLLKLEYSPAVAPRHGWRRTVRVQRQELADDLTASLRRELADDLAALYRDGRENAADGRREFGEDAAADSLPSDSPYTLDQILGDWLPRR